MFSYFIYPNTLRKLQFGRWHVLCCISYFKPLVRALEQVWMLIAICKNFLFLNTGLNVSSWHQLIWLAMTNKILLTLFTWSYNVKMRKLYNTFYESVQFRRDSYGYASDEISFQTAVILRKLSCIASAQKYWLVRLQTCITDRKEIIAYEYYFFHCHNTYICTEMLITAHQAGRITT